MKNPTLKDLHIHPPTPKGTEELLGEMFDLERKAEQESILEDENLEMKKMDGQDQLQAQREETFK